MKQISIALFCLLATSIAHAGPANVEACVDERIQTFRQLEGPDAAIRMDILGEWEAQCKAGIGMSADPTQACVDKRIDAFRRHNGPDAPIRMDILGEWETECQ